MQSDLIVAAVQMNSGESKPANYAKAESLVRQAVEAGARIVVLPEYFNSLGDRRSMLAEAEDIPGPTSTWLAELARELRIVLVGGTFCERSPDAARAYNTSLTFDATGECIARYRKLHLFDVDLPGRLTYCETSWLAPGEDVVVRDFAIPAKHRDEAQSAADEHSIRSALAICYDLRFPELFRRFADAAAELIVVPAAFTKTTGRDHWELLCRVRALENQCFLIASNQTGKHAALETYGHSMIVDPWGVVLAQAEDEEGIASAVISRTRLEEVRAQLPALKHRRTF
ncbi:MAG: carbon-nitrogen hydrolase family protein [Planctomycetia bacterium]|nr:carbon-nitrogen hydrolase family protein [Planctomycetia bacterium]